MTSCCGQMVYLQCKYSSADFFPFLHPTIVCFFSFTEVKMSITVVICVPSPLSAVDFLSSPCCYSSCRSPQAAPRPYSCQLLKPRSLAVHSCASPTMATNVCTSLKTAMTELVCQISHLILLGLVITPHPAVAVSTSVENGTINDIIVLDVLLLSVL